MSVTNNHYSYMDEAFPGANSMARYQSQPVAPTGTDGEIESTEEKETALFGDDGFGFDDFLDIINPLQHLPIISTIYRELTGDDLSPGSRIIGGGIFGGGIGLATSVLNTAIEAGTGKDIGGHVMAMLSDDEETVEETGILAAAPAAEKPQATDQQAAAAEAAKVVAAQSTSQPLAIKTALKTEKQNLTSVKEVETGTKPALFMGLKWKGTAPDVHQKIENANSSQESGLSEAQLSQILNSFRTDKVNKPLSPTTNPDKTAASVVRQDVQKAAVAYDIQPGQNERNRLISDSFDYLDRLI